MNLFESNWIFLPLLLLLVLMGLYVFGKKSVHHETTVSASPEEVWAVLTDTRRYPEWNPVITSATGRLEQGQVVKYTFRQDESNEYVISATVKKMASARLLNQVGGTPGILTFNHRYVLDPLPSGTRITIHEDYKGIFVPFWNPGPVELAYEKLNQAISDRVVKVRKDEPHIQH